jgi:hypothetical protein
MSEILIFNHIPKTAGSTVKYILWHVAGPARVLGSVELNKHRDRVQEIARFLDQPLEGRYIIQSHAGVGFEQRLPARHAYRTFVFLRDPSERAISHYFFGRDLPDAPGGIPSEMSLLEFLREDTVRAYNAQTAFLGGLWAEHNLNDVVVSRAQFDQALLERAKRNLELHDALGLTERFDESLLLLRRAFGWSARRTVYRSMNFGQWRKGRPLSPEERKAVRANNELDEELYAFGRELLVARLERVRARRARLKGFRALNTSFQHLHHRVYSPGLERVRRLRKSA